jgi:hypothetical protein
MTDCSRKKVLAACIVKEALKGKRQFLKTRLVRLSMS